ncbi:hypothetical protein J2Z22_003135 [Paenibacillus forsythiae]|uniref:Uncharacterized protein n=1 Tax=Paenibacillus forsythiae TaxID=365616 RepID=A0ABU3H9R2_9BACL|nr:hypothetical protein [Paenibacillus forsythiae]MDT3427572.1 hypothetical protein [Paenibacillus forsythiae]
MDNTNVKVQFNIIGEDFCPTEATDRLQVIPTKYWVKGDGIPGKSMCRK